MSLVARALIALWMGLLIGLTNPAPILAQTVPPRPNAAQAVQTPPPSRTSPAEPLVSIDFNNVDIGVFVKFMSDLTKKNFVVDDKVRGKVTIISPGKITVAEAYKVFESVLEVYGFSAVPSGEITKIIPSPDARTKNIKTRLEEESGEPDDTVVTQIIPLRYADPDEVKRLFTPLVSRNSVILSYAPTNTLIITDVYSNIRRLLKILKSIDITGVGQQIAIIPVNYSDATKLVTLLTAIFQPPQKAKAPTQKDITFVADERTNTIVVLASEGDVDNIRRLVKSLDKETPRGQSKIHVYYLENASAEDLAKVLMDIPQKAAGDSSDKGGGKPSAPVVSDKVRITADKATNSLIIMADMEDYLTLEGIIRKIDIPRAMVYIEALIMEVNVEKDFNLGTEWILGGKTSYDGNDAVFGGGFRADDPIIKTNTIDGTLIPSLPSGMSMGIFGEALTISGITFPSISAVVQAYKKDRDVRILSTPQILTTDNQEAKIYVGKNVPFQTTATASTTGTEIYNSFEYRDVGKTLKITPQISKDRQVRLELALEVTALESAADNRPTTLKRTVETTAVVQDGNTVVLGGLIDDSQGVADYRVPCLGDVPGMGLLFRSKATAREKSNLYVFLTPRVLQKPDEIEKISQRKREEIDSLSEDNIKLYDPKRSGDPATPPPIVHPQGAGAPIEQRDLEPSASAAMTDEDKSYDPREAFAEKAPDPGALPDHYIVPAPPGASNGSGPKEVSPAPAKSGAASASELSPTPARAQTGLKNGEHGYTLQVASVQTPQEADTLVQELMRMGYAAYAVRSQVDGQTWYRLRIGYFATRAEADPVMDRLRAQQYTPMLIKL
jgi:general secretion pathway protein D